MFKSRVSLVAARALLAMILAVFATASGAHEAAAYRLPGDPDSLVRRGPEIMPTRAPDTDTGLENRAVRVEDLPPSPVRRAPETRLTVSREIFLPRYLFIFRNQPWQLRIKRKGGELSGDLTIGPRDGRWWPVREEPATLRGWRAGRPDG